ncbi:hypothetical protein M409DRAFT_49487 [Zasmidium cellare ATCC 36951]|uniref:C2H2-type domain-containing protein n=1 Tax=Zasmidium cellare ATCC 36951 TaxID=1080233 RepID=A0A6A6D0J6_ZASCE|nr:uncharacterized protein M409DRAFT_49487 [Zasmidium cellare ATCC 36951]KAF2172987.1 hypothetical protein M409DRAFT_49487 [Zasmidium cellare ATCC 36951]
MSRFEESALRNSATGDANPSTLPYWHPSSQFSSLINPQHDASIHNASGIHHSDGEAAINYPAFNGEHLHEHGNLDFDMSSAHSQLTDFNQAAQDFNGSLTVKTPTGSRSMRRPGLAGAAALVNGHYCCQWSGNGMACRHKFLDAKSLNDHIRTHHVRGAGTFVCQWSGCDKGSFPTANKLVRHVHSHTGYKPFPCSHCSQAFVTKDQLDKHLTTHTGAKDFVCTWPGCGRSFAVKHALDGHMNSVHLKAKKHICPYCLQAFDDSSNLSKHKKQVHNPETGIKCPARHTHGCTYVDSRKDKMKEHCERDGHGLETVRDPHAWNLWVQQFKTHCKKSHCRRQSVMSGSPMSRGSSMSVHSFAARHRNPSIECSKQGCNIPVCLPCNILCNDAHSAHDSLPPCGEPDCDPCEPCDPCDPCNDPDCDLVEREPCGVPPCSIPHCRGGTSTPSQPATPHLPPATYFQYHPMSTAEEDLFQDAEHPFQLSAARLTEYMFMNG